MLLTVDRDLQAVVVSPNQRSAISSLNFKHTNAEPSALGVQFCRNGLIEDIGDDTNAAVIFILKIPGQYDGDAAVNAQGFTKTGASTTALYTLAVSTDTATVRALLGIDGMVGNDVPACTLMGAIQWTDSTGAVFESQTFTVTLANNVVKGTESLPANAGVYFFNKAQSDGRYARFDSGLYGSAVLPAGLGSYIAAGLALPFLPKTVLAWVDTNAGAAVIFGAVDRATITQAGFTVNFNGLPPDAAHVVNWLCLPDPAAFGTVDAEAFPAGQTVAVAGAAAAIDLSIPGGLILLDLTAATGVVALTLNNPVVGRSYLMEVVQGATPRNATFPAGTKQKGGGGVTYVASGASLRDLIRIVYDGTRFLINVEDNYA